MEVKIKKILIVILSLSLLFIFSGCSTVQTHTSILQGTNSQKQSLQSKQVVENYFKFYNEKNKDGLLSTLTEWHNAPNVVFGLDNLEYIKLNKIAEDVRPSKKEAYIKYGRGKINGTKEENIVIYKVEYTVKYKKDGIEPQNSGTYTKWCTIIRKDKNSLWLIDEIGEG